MQAMMEKRRETRRDEDSIVRFEGDDFSIYSRMVDVSEHGAFLATNYLLDPGTQIHVYLEESPRPKSAEVVHSNATKDREGRKVLGLGLRFRDLD